MFTVITSASYRCRSLPARSGLKTILARNAAQIERHRARIEHSSTTTRLYSNTGFRVQQQQQLPFLQTSLGVRYFSTLSQLHAKKKAGPTNKKTVKKPVEEPIEDDVELTKDATAGEEDEDADIIDMTARRQLTPEDLKFFGDDDDDYASFEAEWDAWARSVKPGEYEEGELEDDMGIGDEGDFLLGERDYGMDEWGGFESERDYREIMRRLDEEDRMLAEEYEMPDIIELDKRMRTGEYDIQAFLADPTISHAEEAHRRMSAGSAVLDKLLKSKKPVTVREFERLRRKVEQESKEDFIKEVRKQQQQEIEIINKELQKAYKSVEEAPINQPEDSETLKELQKELDKRERKDIAQTISDIDRVVGTGAVQIPEDVIKSVPNVDFVLKAAQERQRGLVERVKELELFPEPAKKEEEELPQQPKQIEEGGTNESQKKKKTKKTKKTTKATTTKKAEEEKAPKEEDATKTTAAAEPASATTTAKTRAFMTPEEKKKTEQVYQEFMQEIEAMLVGLESKKREKDEAAKLQQKQQAKQEQKSQQQQKQQQEEEEQEEEEEEDERIAELRAQYNEIMRLQQKEREALEMLRKLKQDRKKSMKAAFYESRDKKDQGYLEKIRSAQSLAEQRKIEGKIRDEELRLLQKQKEHEEKLKQLSRLGMTEDAAKKAAASMVKKSWQKLHDVGVVSRRQLSVAEIIHRALIDVLVEPGNDPRLRDVTVMDVSMSKDMKFANVYWNAMEPQQVKELTVLLDKCAPYLSAEVGKKIALKYTPKLRFEYQAEDEHTRIENLFASLGFKDPELEEKANSITSIPSASSSAKKKSSAAAAAAATTTAATTTATTKKKKTSKK
eukprot:GEZU01013491.1.p1 GENE.GEZU01013491.1~~GEZU01013491.1.p1  ORF type:complete len:844 (-),score=358.74 GEZU01013491.1:833-3364(-)